MDRNNILTCEQCEYFGNCEFPVVRYYVDGKLEAKFEGYSDRINGNVVEHPARKCDEESNRGKVIVYDNITACNKFKQRTWQRPATCRECDLKCTRYTDGSFSCSGSPFTQTHTNKDNACINGKKFLQRKQLSIFDL